MINKKIILSASFLFMILLAGNSISTLTSITLNSPQSNANISGIYLLNATLSSGDSANFTDFWWYDGTQWHLIGENDTIGSSFTFHWNTSTVNDGVIKVKANASNGSVNVESNLAEEVTVDNTFPLIENVTNTSIGQWSAVIEFDTSEKANASINYGETLNLGSVKFDSSYSTTHSISLTGLTENKTYYYNITACDFSGNCNVTGVFNFTTLNVVPSISNVQVNADNESALISWTTSENANSTVNYGTTTSLGTVVGNASNVTSHSINLTGLTNGTTYYYNVTSCDLVGNCNTTGVFNFTTDLDDTPPVFEGGLTFQNSAGEVVSGVNEDEYINITASVGDNIKVDKVWAEVSLENGTVFNETMTILNGSGTLSDKYLASLYYNCTSSGLQHVIVFANDTSGNLAQTAEDSWNVYGYFTLLTSINSGYKNFSNGGSFNFVATVINDRQDSDNYSLEVVLKNSSGSNINNTRGWLIAVNATSALNVASADKAYFKITVTVPLNASDTFYVYLKANESAGKSEEKTLSFPQEKITISLPSEVKVSNSSSYTEFLYEYYNYSKTAWMKTIKVLHFSVSSEVSANLSNSTFACGLYQNGKLKKAGVVEGTNNSANTALKVYNATCSVNVTGLTAGNYNLTLNVTDDKKHKGNAYKEVLVPSSINVSASDETITKGLTFTLSGSAYYSEDSDFKVVHGFVKASYDGKVCSGYTSTSGAFSLSCPAISKTGTFDLNLIVYGVFNISKEKAIKLTVKEKKKNTSNEKLNIVPSSSSITLKNKAFFTVTIFNNYLESKEVSLKVNEEGETRHFEVSYPKETVTIASGGNHEFKVNLSSFEFPKPGSYKLIISSGSFSKEVTVVIPGFSYEPNSLNTNRFMEKQGDKTVIGIELVNSLSSSVSLNLTETIPKDVANSTDLISFSLEPVIIQKDPIVLWTLNLSAGEKKTITYTVKKNVNDSVAGELEKPTVFISSFGSPKTSQQSTKVVVENTSRKVIYIAIIFILAGVAIFYILFKDKIFKSKPKDYLNPSFIEKSKRKLLGDKKYHFEPSKKPEEKKQEERVFNFSGVSNEEDKE